jgi:hypothetical protein
MSGLARRNPILLNTLAVLKAAGTEMVQHHRGKHIRVSAVYRARKAKWPSRPGVHGERNAIRLQKSGASYAPPKMHRCPR